MLVGTLPSVWMVLGWRPACEGTERMARKVADAEKSEKITINVGLVDLGQIDLLVREGFFANRTDFIRTAIRRQLDSRSNAVDRTVARRELVLGSEPGSCGQPALPVDVRHSRKPGLELVVQPIACAGSARGVSPGARAVV